MVNAKLKAEKFKGGMYGQERTSWKLHMYIPIRLKGNDILSYEATVKTAPLI